MCVTGRCVALVEVSCIYSLRGNRFRFSTGNISSSSAACSMSFWRVQTTRYSAAVPSRQIPCIDDKLAYCSLLRHIGQFVPSLGRLFRRPYQTNRSLSGVLRIRQISGSLLGADCCDICRIRGVWGYHAVVHRAQSRCESRWISLDGAFDPLQDGNPPVGLFVVGGAEGILSIVQRQAK